MAALSLLFCACNAAGSGRPEPRLDGEGAAEDLRLVAAWVAEAHPRPYRYQSQPEFEVLRDRLADALAQEAEPDDLELGSALRRLLAPLRDGHVAFALPSFQPGYSGARAFLPIALRVLPEGLFVDGDNAGIAHGSRVTAIDGVPASEVVSDLAALVMADGVGEGPRLASLDHEFSMLFHTRYGFRESHELSLAGDSGVRVVTVESVPYEELPRVEAARRTRPRWVRRLAPEQRLPALSWLTSEIARLDLPTFGIADEAAFEQRVREAFEALGPARALLLDLRGNQGGFRTLGGHVLSHLLAAPFRQWDWVGVRIRSIPSRFSAHVMAFPGTSLAVLGTFPQRLDGGLHRIEGDPLEERFAPKAPRFGGKIVALVDGLTASAASETLAALLHDRPEAEVVGSETMGPCADHVGEIPSLLTTPNFGIGVLLSLAQIDQVDQRDCLPERGTIPDVPVEPSMADVLAGRDPVLERALAIAEE